MKLDDHSIKRGKQLGINPNELKSIFSHAVYNGYHSSNCPVKEIAEYIQRKSEKKGSNFKVKVLYDIVFIYYKHNKEMITCYYLPKRFIGILDYTQSELDKHKLERND